MGDKDTHPPSYFQATLNKPRVKTSKHVCKHLRRTARRERAYARGAPTPKRKEQHVSSE